MSALLQECGPGMVLAWSAREGFHLIINKKSRTVACVSPLLSDHVLIEILRSRSLSPSDNELKTDNLFVIFALLLPP